MAEPAYYENMRSAPSLTDNSQADVGAHLDGRADLALVDAGVRRMDRPGKGWRPS